MPRKATEDDIQYLVGIDDTDNLESRGTGYHSRQLGSLISSTGIGTMLDITRHQLLFDRRIPYTSHNSSLCLRIDLPLRNYPALVEACRDYLLRHSAPGSDAGLCLVAWGKVAPVVESFGARAKREILTLAEARQLAAAEDIALEGLTGDHGGMIGALAAVGLRKGARDGRIAWRPGIRETAGIVTAGYLLEHTGTDAVISAENGDPLNTLDRINVDPWPRSVLIDGKAVVLVERTRSTDDNFDWQIASRDILRQY